MASKTLFENSLSWTSDTTAQLLGVTLRDRHIVKKRKSGDTIKATKLAANLASLVLPLSIINRAFLSHHAGAGPLVMTKLKTSRVGPGASGATVLMPLNPFHKEGADR